MKKIGLNICSLLVTATVLSGCGKSEPETKPTEQKANPAPSSEATAKPTVSPAREAGASALPQAAAPSPKDIATPTPSATPASTTPPAQPDVVTRTEPAPTNSLISQALATKPSDAAAQLVETAKAKGDKVLTSVSTELTDKVKALTDSASGNSVLKSQLTNALQSLAAGKDAAGLTSIYQVAQSANLTATQLQLAKDVGNVASAYVVQKNFATLDGAQSDVATIVSSLRQGQITPAVPALQKVAQNASLTAPQKELVASIADKYAPGVSKAAGLLQQGLHSIPGLGGSGK